MIVECTKMLRIADITPPPVWREQYESSTCIFRPGERKVAQDTGDLIIINSGVHKVRLPPNTFLQHFKLVEETRYVHSPTVAEQKELWIRVYAAAISNGVRGPDITRHCDAAIELFKERFSDT